jgi:hypothetical protein
VALKEEIQAMVNATTIPTNRKASRAVALTCLLALAYVGLVADRACATTPSADLRPEPISAVILADESGSETTAGIRAERDAAVALVQSDPSAASSYMVAGFGSENRPGQKAVTPYCDFIKTSSTSARASLAACAAEIRARTRAEGNDTDQAQALAFAIQQLRSRPGRKVIFLMTDGRLDVSSSPTYGRIPSQRTPEALRILEQDILPAARAAGIQLWPLGFGPNASSASLEPFAVRGAGVNGRCASSRASKPRAIVVTDVSAIVYRLLSAQTNARCGSVGAPSRATVTSASSITLRVRIPAIASYGALTVVTGSPKVRTTFITPDGVEVPSDGSLDGQIIHQTGAGTDVRTLRIVGPMPGVWTVKLTAPQDLAEETRVTAFASWQGILSASLFASPVQAIPGRPVNVDLHVLSRTGVVAGPGLARLTASAAITGTFGRLAVPLRRSETGFHGSATLPNGATGDLLVSGRVSGVGIAGDETTQTIHTQSYDFLSAAFDVEVPSDIHPGSLLQGRVTTINQGAATWGTLRLAGFSPGALVTITSDPVAIPSGTSTVPFTLRVSPRTAIGPTFVSVVLARKHGGDAIAGTTVDMRVVPAPSWWDGARAWLVPGSIALLLLAVAVTTRARVRAVRRARASDTEGLAATLLVDGVSAGPALSSDGGETFRLSLVAGEPPQLVHADVAGPSGMEIAIRRMDHSASVAIDVDEPRRCRFGEPLTLAPGLALRIDAEDPVPVERHGPAPNDVLAEDTTSPHDSSVITGRWR